MPYDATFDAKIGSKPVLTAQLVAPTGTYTITGGSFTLYNSSDQIILGPVAISGFTPGASENPNATFLLDTTSSGIVVGQYSGNFLLTVARSIDALIQNISYDIQVNIVDYFIGAVATYPVGTPLGDCRFYCGDTNVAQAVFSDAELNQCLVNSGYIPTLAASLALEAAASDNAKLTFAVTIGEFKKDATELAAQFRTQAKELRAISIVQPIVRTPDRMFFQNFEGQGGNPGNMTLW